MTVDLEDYYCDLDFESWAKFESRLELTTNTLLELFDNYDIKATFFTLGYTAEKFPDLVKKIHKKGHEVASHGYAHRDIRKLNSSQFEEDLLLSIQSLQKIIGEKILGFRAPFFSINKKNLWAFEIIRKYLKYDSSIFPVWTPLYGIPDAPRTCYNPSKQHPLENDPNESFYELPLATHHIPILGNIPVAGGFHLRFFPYKYLKYSINKINKNGNIAICYIHPKDLDKNMPKISGYDWTYYYGLNKSKKKFEQLLQDFHFSSVKEILKIRN